MLQNVPLFANLSPAERRTLARAAIVRAYPKNSVILNEGEHTDSIYVINSGKVKVLMRDEEGKEVILSILKEGDYFGELSLIDEQPRSASVVAMEPSEMTLLLKADFLQCVASNPGIAMTIMRGLAQRLREADVKIESLALMDVYGRVARTLLQLAEPENGRLVIKEKLSQREIANMIGASREMVSRILKDLAQEGYIVFEGKHIILNEKTPVAAGRLKGRRAAATGTAV